MRTHRTSAIVCVVGLGCFLGYVVGSGYPLPTVVSAQPPAGQDDPYPVDRNHLPIPEPAIPHSTVLDARNAKAPPRFEVKAPAQAPNVLIVLIDDMGFGQSSAFGGPVHMPTCERLAKAGLRYN